MNEKRKSKRFFEKNKAVINFSLVENEIGQNSNIASTWDISIDGARLFTNAYFPPGAKIIITLDLSRSNLMVKLWAKVKWIKELRSEVGKYEMGIEFIHSVQTLPELVKHFYGQDLIDINHKKDPKVKSIPVQVSESSRDLNLSP